MMKKIFMTVMLLLLWHGVAFGAHPLITDDTGTQGAGKMQIEVNGEYAREGGDSDAEVGAIVSFGLGEDMDLVLSAPYQFLRFTGEQGGKTSEEGFSDIGGELKWRFYERGSLGFAVKPGVTIPTGDEEKGLGEGEASYGLVLITTKTFGSSAVDVNIGFIRNREELRDIWLYSLAGEYGLAENLVLVGNVGGQTNPDPGSDTHPAFVLGGLIYSVSDGLDIDAGMKAGLNGAEADYAVLAGMALRI
ncbi:MAG: transporter [Nitrospirota bacterium]|jgi:hypothetical protein